MEGEREWLGVRRKGRGGRKVQKHLLLGIGSHPGRSMICDVGGGAGDFLVRTYASSIRYVRIIYRTFLELLNIISK